MSILDTENIYPNDDFWIELGFIDLKRRGLWVNSYTKHLHWDFSDTGTRWGNVRIYIEYRKYSKELIIIQHSRSFYYDEVDFEPSNSINQPSRKLKWL